MGREPCVSGGGPTAAAETALRRVWQELADACLEHDREHERRALAELGLPEHRGEPLT